MTGKKLQRLLACLLAVLLLSQVGAFLPAARAAGGYSLQNGTAIIKSGMSDAEVNRALTRALVVGFDQMSEADQNALLDSLTWEYYTKAVAKLLKKVVSMLKLSILAPRLPKMTTATIRSAFGIRMLR